LFDVNAIFLVAWLLVLCLDSISRLSGSVELLFFLIEYCTNFNEVVMVLQKQRLVHQTGAGDECKQLVQKCIDKRE